MTEREIFHQIMEFKPVPRIPNYELGPLAQTVERWVTEGMPRDMVHLNFFEGSPYFRVAHRHFAYINIWMMPWFEYEVLEETERYITARNIYGIVTKALKEGSVGGGRACMDQYLSHPVTDRKSFQEIKKRYNPASLTRYPLLWDEHVRMYRESPYPVVLLENGSFGLYSQLRSWVGTENISYMFYDDPALVEEMLDFNTDFLLAVVDKALNQVRFDYFSFFEDLAGKGGPLISPEMFRKFLMPRYKKIIERFRKAGIRWFWYDTDGDAEVLIPLLIETGITCLFPMEQASGMDPVRLRKKFGKDIAFAGGIDKRQISRDKKSIEKELYAKIPPMLESGGYIPHLDHCFPEDISYDNFLYYLELKRKLTGSK